MSAPAYSTEDAARVSAAVQPLKTALIKLVDIVAADEASETPLMRSLAARIASVRDALRPLPTATSDVPAQDDEAGDLLGALAAVNEAIDTAQAALWRSIEAATHEDLGQAISRLSDLASVIRWVREDRAVSVNS